MALTIVVLPDPDGPNSAVSRPSDWKRACKAKAPCSCRMSTSRIITRETLRRTRRASHSDSQSAATEMAMDTSVSRIAPPSPPGTCV